METQAISSLGIILLFFLSIYLLYRLSKIHSLYDFYKSGMQDKKMAKDVLITHYKELLISITLLIISFAGMVFLLFKSIS